MRLQGHRRDGGFTLLEMIIVVIIFGILTAASLTAVTVWIDQARRQVTKTRLDGIREALTFYVEQQGRFPCPAPYNAAADTATYGREDATCPAAMPAITAVVQGTVPSRDLALPDEYMVDGWNNRFTYAVTEILTKAGPTFYDANIGTITVKDGGGFDITTEAAFVLLSHGEDGKGSWTQDAVANAEGCGAAVARDDENCNGDDVFVSTPVRATTPIDDPAHYDDNLWFDIKRSAGAANCGVRQIIMESADDTYTAAQQDFLFDYIEQGGEITNFVCKTTNGTVPAIPYTTSTTSTGGPSVLEGKFFAMGDIRCFVFASANCLRWGSTDCIRGWNITGIMPCPP